MTAVVALPTLDSLNEFVRETLCARDRLDPVQTPLTRAPVLRRGRVCGLFYALEGPRLLRTHAVWAGEEHRVLFYDSTGSRFAEYQLSDAPDPHKVVTSPA